MFTNYGKRLLLELLRKAKALGYGKVRLETVPRLEIANGLYIRVGFYSIDGDRNNPDDKVFAMEFDLSTLKNSMVGTLPNIGEGT